MDKVSVIIPTWNRAETIEQAIRGALEQTLPPIEVLVCDDGSSDNTKDIVNSIGDSRIKWVEGPRGGRPAIPRNRGIKAAQGDWLAFLDSDDEWLPEKLEKQLDAAKKHGCLASSTNAYRFIPGKGVQGNLLTWAEERINFAALVKVNQVICSSALIHKSLFEMVYGFPEEAELKALEDYATWLRVATLTDIAYVNEPLVMYRDDAANSVRSEDPNVWIQRKHVFNNLLTWLKQNKLSGTYEVSVGEEYKRALVQLKPKDGKGLKAMIKRLVGR